MQPFTSHGSESLTQQQCKLCHRVSASFQHSTSKVICLCLLWKSMSAGGSRQRCACSNMANQLQLIRTEAWPKNASATKLRLDCSVQPL